MQLSPHSLFHPCHECIRLDGLRGEAVVLPPCGQRCADGEAGADHLLELGVVDGQYRLARCAEQLICQGEAQRCGTGQSTGGDGTVGNDMCVNSLIPFSCMFVCF